MEAISIYMKINTIVTKENGIVVEGNDVKEPMLKTQLLVLPNKLKQIRRFLIVEKKLFRLFHKFSSKLFKEF
jgi:hypothetical protein